MNAKERLLSQGIEELHRVVTKDEERLEFYWRKGTFVLSFWTGQFMRDLLTVGGYDPAHYITRVPMAWTLPDGRVKQACRIEKV